jgi:hypothetical protein
MPQPYVGAHHRLSCPRLETRANVRRACVQQPQPITDDGPGLLSSGRWSCHSRRKRTRAKRRHDPSSHPGRRIHIAPGCLGRDPSRSRGSTVLRGPRTCGTKGRARSITWVLERDGGEADQPGEGHFHHAQRDPWPRPRAGVPNFFGVRDGLAPAGPPRDPLGITHRRCRASRALPLSLRRSSQG